MCVCFPSLFCLETWGRKQRETYETRHKGKDEGFNAAADAGGQDQSFSNPRRLRNAVAEVVAEVSVAVQWHVEQDQRHRENLKRKEEQ